MSAVKYMLFTINVIFVLIGAALCIAGAIFYTNTASILFVEEYVKENGDLKTFFIAAIVLGAIIFFISFLGCCGAIKENICMLSTYSVILIVLAILKTALIVYFYFKRQDIYGNIPIVLNNVYKNSPENIHQLEKSIRCCGVTHDTYDSVKLPETCCAVTPCIENLKYLPCSQKIQMELSHHELTIGIILALIIVFELLAAIVSCCLGHKSRKETNSTPSAPYR